MKRTRSRCGRPRGPLKALLTAALTMAMSLAPARADLPVLPFPTAPPSSTQVMAGQLAAGLFRDGDVGSFVVAIESSAMPSGVRSAPLATHLTDAVEAAIRRLIVAGPRVDKADPSATERIDIRLSIEEGHLAAVAKRTRLAYNIWDRMRFPRGRVVATAFSNVAIDLELRTLMELGRRKVRLDRLRVVPVGSRSLDGLARKPVLDLAVADLDGDRFSELAVLQADAVTVAAWADGGFSQPRGAHTLEALAPAPARLRQPVGRLVPVVRPDGSVVLAAASSEYRNAIVMALVEGVLAPLGGVEAGDAWPLYQTRTDTLLGGPWPSRGVDTLSGTVREVTLEAGSDNALGEVSGIYDIRVFEGRAATSPSWNPHIVASEPAETLTLLRASKATAPAVFPRQGTVAVVTDLDANGVSELLTTSTTLSGPDTLTLRDLRDDRARTLWRGQAAAPVTAAAVGDVDRDGYDEIVIATWDGQRADLAIVVPASR